MKPSRTFRAFTALAAAMLVSSAAPLWARTKSLPPNVFRAAYSETGNSYYLSPTRLSSTGILDRMFWATVKLPVGQKIRAVTVGVKITSPGATVSVGLYRVRAREESESLGSLVVAGDTGGLGQYNLDLAGDLTVGAGYQYYVNVVSSGGTAFFYGAKLTYR